MIEETENVTDGGRPDSPSAVPFTPPRPGIFETGEGSLLEHTRSLVDASLKPTVSAIDLEGGERALINLGHEGSETTLEVLNPAAFDPYRKFPLYVSGTAQLGDLDSFIAYTNRHKDSDSVVFASDDRKSPSITSVLDYSRQGGPDDDGQRFGRHQAQHLLPLSDEWKAWAELNSSGMTMPNFARFLEDHIIDVLPVGMVGLSETQTQFVEALGGRSRIADPAKLMELATGLRIHEDSQVGQVTNLQSGEGELILTSNHTDGSGNKLMIPSMFVIAIPVFRHGEPYQILVRLRYRKRDGITFIYELWREDRVFDHAFDEALTRIREETSLTVYRGKRGDS